MIGLESMSIVTVGGGEEEGGRTYARWSGCRVGARSFISGIPPAAAAARCFRRARIIQKMAMAETTMTMRAITTIVESNQVGIPPTVGWVSFAQGLTAGEVEAGWTT
jgi:hypothetical protein